MSAVVMVNNHRQKFPLRFELFVLILPPSPSVNQLPNKQNIAQPKQGKLLSLLIIVAMFI